MKLADAFLTEFDLEVPYTRQCLERVPIEKFDWKPHDKSMTLGWLATFSAVMWSWGSDALQKDEFDFAALPPEARSRKNAASSAELLAMFDENVAAARAAIIQTSDEHFMTPWTLRVGEKVIFSEPRWQVLRHYVFNHAVHHRGQLTVYLRLLGIPVPAIYNDSADEHGGMFIATTKA